VDPSLVIGNGVGDEEPIEVANTSDEESDGTELSMFSLTVEP
jgi:hypothetical protein